jgi:hypothetical protein
VKISTVLDTVGLGAFADKATAFGRALLGRARDLLEGETLLAINFGAIIVIYLSWHLALAMGWSHVPAPALDVIVLAVGSASTAIATFARRFVSSPATVGTLEAVIEYWRGLYEASRDTAPAVTDLETPQPIAPAEPIAAPEPTPVVIASPPADPADGVMSTACGALNAYGGMCVLELGHDGSHRTASGSTWARDEVGG